MDKETRIQIEAAYSMFNKQLEDKIELTDAGKLMYTMLVALIELDNKIDPKDKIDGNINFYS